MIAVQSFPGLHFERSIGRSPHPNLLPVGEVTAIHIDNEIVQRGSRFPLPWEED